MRALTTMQGQPARRSTAASSSLARCRVAQARGELGALLQLRLARLRGLPHQVHCEGVARPGAKDLCRQLGLCMRRSQQARQAQAKSGILWVQLYQQAS